MLMLVVLASAAFTCLSPAVHDGDTFRCAGLPVSIRLYGIDAPEMPGACLPDRRCTPGDPYTARNRLAALMRTREVICRPVERDQYGRLVARCAADGEDLSCAMIERDHAVARYGFPACALRRALARFTTPSGEVPQWVTLVSAVIAVNAVAYAAMALDKRAAQRRGWRWSERSILTLALLGGSPAILMARHRLRHKTRKQPFGLILLVITGVQAGALAGLALLHSGVV